MDHFFSTALRLMNENPLDGLAYMFGWIAIGMIGFVIAFAVLGMAYAIAHDFAAETWRRLGH